MQDRALIHSLRHYAVGALLFALGSVLTLHLWQTAETRLEETVRERLSERTRKLAHQLRDRVHGYENILFGAAGLLQANPGRVSPAQWRTFAESLALLERYKGFNGMGYVAMLSPAEVPAHEARMRQWGVPDYRVKGDGHGAVSSAVTFIYPDTYTRNTYGVDIYATGPLRRVAIDHARDLGQLSFTKPLVPMVNPDGKQPASAIVAYVPVYDISLPRGSVAERRIAFRGFAFVSTFVREMLDSLDAGTGDVRVRLYDVDADGTRTPIASLPAGVDMAATPHATGAAITLEEEIQLGGRHWVLQADATPGIVTTWQRRYPMLVLIFGLSLSASLAGVLAVLTNTRRRAVRLADHMTAELRSSRQNLQQKSSELEAIQTASPLGLFHTGEDGRRLVMANPRSVELLRPGTSSLQDVDWVNCLHQQDRAQVASAIGEWMAGARSGLALECRAAPGEAQGEAMRWLRITAASAQSGRTLVGTVEDVTIRKQEEIELERTREFLRAVLDLLPVVIYARDAHSRYVLENPCALAFLNSDLPTLVGRTVEDVFGSQYAEWAKVEDQRAMQTTLPQSREGEFVDLAGGRHWMRMFKRGLRLSNGEGYVVGVNIDLTEQHALETQARRSREFLAALLDALPAPLFVKDRDGRYVMVNDAFARFHGRRREDLVGVTDAQFIPESDALANAAENDLLLRDHRAVASERREVSPDGNLRWMLKNKALIDLPDGQQYIVGVMFDIDERVRAREELRLHRDNLQQLVEQRTAEIAVARDFAEAANRAKSEFLANMSHELRTPMHAILSFSSIGRDRVAQPSADPAKMASYFTRIQDSAARLLRLLNDLLDLAKLESGKMEYNMAACQVATLVEDAVREFEALGREKRVRLWVHQGPPVQIWADALRIGQVLRNMLSNAIKFSPPDGTIHIQWMDAIGETQDVRISVRDEGVGIPEQELAQIFDKFVQSSKTKSGAGGTGLGLSICREIISAHQGRMWAENNPEGGAGFHLCLPSRAPLPSPHKLSALGA